MGIALKILSGDQKDQLFPIEDGLTIGRQSRHIKLTDPKISSIHARVVKEGPDKWVLVDNNSKNGLILNGEKVTLIELTAGVEFFIGDIGFSVIPHDQALTKKRRLGKGRHLWYDAIADFLDNSLEKIEDRPRLIEPLEPAVMLEFVRGIQMNTRWVLGYGPREVGAGALDLTILEPHAPEKCFEIEGTAGGVLFRTQHPDMVRLNDKKQSQAILRIGDTIRINGTVIEVDFVE